MGLPKSGVLPRPGRITLTIGEPMRFDAVCDPREIAVALARRVRELAIEPR